MLGQRRRRGPTVILGQCISLSWKKLYLYYVCIYVGIWYIYTVSAVRTISIDRYILHQILHTVSMFVGWIGLRVHECQFQWLWYPVYFFLVFIHLKSSIAARIHILMHVCMRNWSNDELHNVISNDWRRAFFSCDALYHFVFDDVFSKYVIWVILARPGCLILNPYNAKIFIV